MKNKTDFCDGCCYRYTCVKDLEKCCYLVRNNCLIEHYSYEDSKGV